MRRTLSAAGMALILIASMASSARRVKSEPDAGHWYTDSAPPAHAHAGDVWVNPKDSAETLYIPAGEFLRGSADTDRAAGSREKPQERVYLDGFWIYKNVVTVGEYRVFCTSAGRKMPKAPTFGWQDDHPIVNVSWNDAAAYATWAGVRLPNEAEWEKAARGADGRIYPWGDAWDPVRCVTSAAGKRKSTAGVGSIPAGASPYGVLDMAGNVWQWCAVWSASDYFPPGSDKSADGPDSVPYRALRGGSWRDDDPGFFRSALRAKLIPYIRAYDDNGFRCVISIQKEKAAK